MILQNEIVVDNFAGGGGASEGMELGLGRHVDIAINHDPLAIDMHKMNHPETKHYCEDVWDVNPVEACEGRPVGLAWFSPDCKHFSKAKGGAPVNARVRGLAWIVLRWSTKVPVRMIMLENVEEFQDWGPIDEDGKPIKELKGRTFKAFIDCLTFGIDHDHPDLDEICEAIPDTPKEDFIDGLGYDVDWKVLRACDYGAPTIRKRLFLVARNDGEEIVWPEPSHNEGGTDGLSPYKTAADIIDWTIPCKSIFNRKKPLAEKTMQRIAKGLQKYVIDSDDPFIVPEAGCAPFITEHANGSSQRNMSANEPLRTQCANVKGGHFAVVTSHMVKFRGNEFGFDTNRPVPTITAGGRHVGEVRAFLSQYYGTVNNSTAKEPLRTVTTKSRLALNLVRIDGDTYEMIDVAMRMLSPAELFLAQGIEEGYVIDIDSTGKKTTIVNRVARCGNAVCPPVAQAIVEANTRPPQLMFN